MSGSPPRVVLVGAGHAHLHALRHATDYARRGVELVLVAPTPFWYSGLATGVLGGRHAAERDRIDVAAWARRGGIRHIAAHARRVDARNRRIEISDGSVLTYDVASFAIGSEVEALARDDDAAPAWPAKPIERLAELRSLLERRFADGMATRVLVVGGGASGCEIAANIRALADAARARAEVRLATAGARLLPGFTAAAAESALRRLHSLGVTVIFDTRVAAVTATGARSVKGAGIDADIVVAATGLRPPPLLRDAGFAVDARGAVRITPHLHTLDDANVFAAGDCAVMDGLDLPRIGVVAVRQAPVLHHNLIAAALGRPLRAYRAQKRFLLILNLGHGRALATWGGHHCQGFTAQWLKDRLDLRFVRSFDTR